MLVSFRGGLEVIDSDQISSFDLPNCGDGVLGFGEKITSQTPTKVEKPLSTLTLLYFEFFLNYDLWFLKGNSKLPVKCEASSCRFYQPRSHAGYGERPNRQALEAPPERRRAPQDAGMKGAGGHLMPLRRKTEIFWRSIFCLFQSVSSHGVCHVMNSSQHFEINLGSCSCFVCPQNSSANRYFWPFGDPKSTMKCRCIIWRLPKPITSQWEGIYIFIFMKGNLY